MAEDEAVAWAILQALHEAVPVDERPMSWSDLKGEQEPRIRAAAIAAIECIRTRDAQSNPPRATIAELDALLAEEDNTPIHINPDGSIVPLEAGTGALVDGKVYGRGVSPGTQKI